MAVSPSLVVDLAFAAATICALLPAAVAWWRHKPYTHQEFAAAMERICAGVTELWAVEGEAGFREGEEFASDEVRALQQKCESMLQDLLRNTCYIVNRADPCCRRDRRTTREEWEIHGCANEVMRQGARLIFYLRWSLLRLSLRPPGLKSCRHTLEAAERYAGLWLVLVRLLEAKYPEFRDQLSWQIDHP